MNSDVVFNKYYTVLDVVIWHRDWQLEGQL